MADADKPLSNPAALDHLSDPQDPWIGETVASYRLVRRIGWGGMGVVYLAEHTSLERPAAVKFLAAHLVNDPGYIEMFLREAKAAARLNHPNIIGVYDAGSYGKDVYYLIMEYVEGRDLASMLKESERLPVARAVNYVRQVCSGLAYAHKKKIVHRDIKPENLLITEDDVVKIGDLGLAKWMGNDSSLTQNGLVMGSPFYIAPERLRGDTTINETTDIYSLGGTFFHLVTGRVPYDGTSPVVMSKHLDHPVPNPRDINPSLDSRLCQIIMKMMAKDQSERYRTMTEVDGDLADYEHSLSHPVVKAIAPPESRHEMPALATVPEEPAQAPPPAPVTGKPAEAEAPEPGRAGGLAKAAFIGIVLLAAAAAIWAVRSRPAPAPKPPTAAPPAAPKPAPEPASQPTRAIESKPMTPEPPKPQAPPAPAGRLLLFDFENGTQGWKIDQGFNGGGPVLSTAAFHRGKAAAGFTHQFDKADDTCAGSVVLEEPVDLTGYREITGWVHVPGDPSEWQFQMFVRSGPDRELNRGKTHRAWYDGWHQVRISTADIKHPHDVRELGVQVKHRAKFRATVSFDDFTAEPK